MPYRTMTTLLKRAQRLGLSHEVAVQFADDHARLFGHHRFNLKLATPDDWRWRRLRDRLQQAWLAVRRPEDWSSYVASADRRCFQQEIDGIWYLFGPRDDDDAPDPHRQRMAKAGSWEGLWGVMDGHAAPASRLFPAATVARTEAGGRRLAEARLQQVLMTCGLRGISWPWDQPSTATHLHRLADHLEEAQRLLQVRTGWTGPLLGLGGRVHLSVDAHLPVMGSQAFFGWRRNHAFQRGAAVRSPLAGWSGGRVTRLMMVTSITSGFTALAHEWFHAFDSVLAMDAGFSGRDGVSELWTRDAPMEPLSTRPTVQMAVQAMNGLVAAIVEGPHPEALFQVAAKEACENWLDGFRAEDDPPLYLTLQRQEDQELREGTWQQPVANLRWQGVMRQRMECLGLVVDDSNPDFQYGWLHRVAQARIQRRLLTGRSLPHAAGQPFWTAVQDFIGRIQRENGQTKWAGYTRLPHEMLAHAFEASFPRPDLLIVETCSGVGSLRFPTRVEAEAHAPRWAALFQALQPWWDEACAPWRQMVDDGPTDGSRNA